METHDAQRPVSHRAVSLIVATLLVLAALTGAVLTAHPVGHQHRNHVQITAGTGAELQGLPGRTGPDATPATGTAADLTTVRFANSTRAAGSPVATAVETLRTRGPPAQAS